MAAQNSVRPPSRETVPATSWGWQPHKLGTLFEDRFLWLTGRLLREVLRPLLYRQVLAKEHWFPQRDLPGSYSGLPPASSKGPVHSWQQGKGCASEEGWAAPLSLAP